MSLGKVPSLFGLYNSRAGTNVKEKHFIFILGNGFMQISPYGTYCHKLKVKPIILEDYGRTG